MKVVPMKYVACRSNLEEKKKKPHNSHAVFMASTNIFTEAAV